MYTHTHTHNIPYNAFDLVVAKEGGNEMNELETTKTGAMQPRVR